MEVDVVERDHWIRQVAAVARVDLDGRTNPDQARRKEHAEEEERQYGGDFVAGTATGPIRAVLGASVTLATG
jgi:hypothetical protein